VEQIREHRRHQSLVRHQLFHLDMQHVGLGELLGSPIKEPAVRTFQSVGRQRRHQRIRLDEHGETGEGAFLPGRGCEALQRRPHRVLHVGRDPHPFICEQRRHPLQGEGDLAGLVDACEGLQRQCPFEAELDAGSAHGERGSACGPAAVEQDDLGADEAPELQSEQPQ
jgi:hypothetical protein